MAVASTFTAVGVSAVDGVPVNGDLTLLLSNTFVASLRMEYSFDLISWQILSPTYGVLTTTTQTLPVKAGSFVRLRCVAFTSGTVTYTFQTPQAVARTDLANLGTDTTGYPTGAPYNNGGVLSIA